MITDEQRRLLDSLELCFISQPEDRKYEFIHNSAVEQVRAHLLNHFYGAEEKKDERRTATNNTEG